MKPVKELTNTKAQRGKNILNNIQFKKNVRPFRLTKNGKPLNVFGKFENAELVENKIPKERYMPAINPEQGFQINNN